MAKYEVNETHEEWVAREWDLCDASNAKPSIVFKYKRNLWHVVTMSSMRVAIKGLFSWGDTAYLLRSAPRGEYTITTKELKVLLRNEREIKRRTNTGC